MSKPSSIPAALLSVSRPLADKVIQLSYTDLGLPDKAGFPICSQNRVHGNVDCPLLEDEHKTHLHNLPRIAECSFCTCFSEADLNVPGVNTDRVVRFLNDVDTVISIDRMPGWVSTYLSDAMNRYINSAPGAWRNKLRDLWTQGPDSYPRPLADDPEGVGDLIAASYVANRLPAWAEESPSSEFISSLRSGKGTEPPLRLFGIPSSNKTVQRKIDEWKRYAGLWVARFEKIIDSWKDMGTHMVTCESWEAVQLRRESCGQLMRCAVLVHPWVNRDNAPPVMLVPALWAAAIGRVPASSSPFIDLGPIEDEDVDAAVAGDVDVVERITLAADLAASGVAPLEAAEVASATLS